MQQAALDGDGAGVWPPCLNICAFEHSNIETFEHFCIWTFKHWKIWIFVQALDEDGGAGVWPPCFPTPKLGASKPVPRSPVAGSSCALACHQTTPQAFFDEKKLSIVKWEQVLCEEEEEEKLWVRRKIMMVGATQRWIVSLAGFFQSRIISLCRGFLGRKNTQSQMYSFDVEQKQENLKYRLNALNLMSNALEIRPSGWLRRWWITNEI